MNRMVERPNVDHLMHEPSTGRPPGFTWMLIALGVTWCTVVLLYFFGQS